MLINGEKYACEACVRGHRVSNCHHGDRPLAHIAKKGRPVTQCAHCRTLRKSRSAHVKCDCTEKSHKQSACPHTKDAEPMVENCCCSHGGRCTCSIKKEHLDPVPESDSDEAPLPTPPNEIRRPRAHTVQSEGAALTVFTNGHHKPAHKHNQMAHKCGMPYAIPRAHSIHGLQSGLANRSVDNLPHTSTIDALHSESHIKDSIVSAQLEQRMIKSEHNSPILGSSNNLDVLNGQLPPLDLSGLGDFSTGLNFTGPYDEFSCVTDIDTPIFSAGLPSTASVDWSHYDGLTFNNDNFAPSNFSQAQSFNGFDYSSIDQPALTTTSTSGEISEVEEFGQFNDVLPVPAALSVPQQYGSDFDASDLSETEKYRLSTTSSYAAIPQLPTLSGNDNDPLDIDEFIEQVAADSNYQTSNSPLDDKIAPLSTYTENKFIPETSGQYDAATYRPTSTEEDDALWMSFTSNHGLPNVTSEPSGLSRWSS